MQVRRWRNSWLAVLGALAGAAGLAGCTTADSVVSRPREPVVLTGGKVGLLVLIPEKKVEFFEMIQKSFVLVDEVDNRYSFDGLWDPKPVLTETLVRALRTDRQLECIPLDTRVDAATLAQLAEEVEAAFNQARCPPRDAPQVAAWVTEFQWSPPLNYFRSPPPARLRQLRDQLGTDLVLEISLAGFVYSTGNTVLLDTSHFCLLAYARLLRLSDGKTLRFTKAKQDIFPGVIVYSFTQVDADNLKLLKANYAQAVEVLMKPDGPLLKGLLK